MIPQDFSYELPARCLALLEGLEDKVPDFQGGPLRTTFLLALAIPLLIIPDQVINGHRRLIMRNVNRLRRDVATIMEAPFCNAPFRADRGESRDRWLYMQFPGYLHHPRELEVEGRGLRNDRYAEDAEGQKTGFVLHQLRNALAHAGVVYLDEEGRYQPERDARMLAFIAEHRGGSYTVLGIMEDDFSAFLRCWARWLGTLGLNELALAA
jgi:hypothetical protein